MPDPAAPHASTTHTLPRPSANGTTPPVLPQAAKTPTRMRWPTALDRFRMAMTPLRRITRLRRIMRRDRRKPRAS
jgi:hypothetical protein